MAQKYEFSDGKNTIELKHVKNAAGLGITAVDIETTQSYRQDGVSVHSITYQSRVFTLEFDIKGGTAAEAEAERKALIKFFGNKSAKTFMYTRGGKKYYLSPVYMAAAYDPDIRELAAQTGTAQFVAGNPYFKSDIPYNSVRTETAVFEVPESGIELPLEGIEFSTAENRMIITNEGGVVSPAYIRFKGMVINPYIQNTTTGEKIKVNKTIYDDEIYGHQTLIINTETHRIDVIDSSNVSHNAFNYIDDESDFNHLAPGENVIEFGSSGGTGYIEIGGMEYYVGV